MALVVCAEISRMSLRVILYIIDVTVAVHFNPAQTECQWCRFSDRIKLVYKTDPLIVYYLEVMPVEK